MDLGFCTLVGLASVQVLIYRIDSKRALKACFLLGFFYFSLFSFTQGLRIFCDLFSISFYQIPLLSLILLLVFAKDINGFPRFQKAFREVPHFYLFSGLWISLSWIGLFQEHSLLSGFFGSFFAAFLLPIMTAIKERLALTDPLPALQGLPLFLVTVGLFLLGFHFFLNFKN